MALDRIQLIELAKASAKASLNPAKTFSVAGQELNADALSVTFTKELNELGKTPQEFRNNKNLIFELLETAITEVIPVKVEQAYGQFADVKTYGNNDVPVFKVNISEASKKRAKQFVTKVGNAGRYETFKLDGYTLTVPTSAYGGAARVEWEEMLDGRFTLNDYYQIILEALDEKIYREIGAALSALINTVGAKNKHSGNTFDETSMDKLLAVADAYGKATIYCTFEFAATMVPNNAGTTNWNAFSSGMKEQVWNNGAFATYKGHQVIILPQSFEDTTHTKKVINPAIAYIIPTGSEKPVKVAFQGGAQVKQFENRDWSSELETYQKIGVATYLVNPGICIYENTSLSINN